ncbi:hypothetical protein FKW77_008512 [Venturia effusa]|uniref:Uncharacterized protein n=1 Tax=Venturia effusa TaxID=50376 RepID=A0A517LCR3_9PEZI|nr:hypothetical protein FKW77_008512 [Venturia effusa]
MGKRVASNSFEQQCASKRGVLAGESCEQQVPAHKSTQMQRPMTASHAPAMTTPEVQAGVRAFLVKEQELEDMTRPQQNLAVTTSFPLPNLPFNAPFAHIPVDALMSSEQSQDVDMDINMRMDSPPAAGSPIPCPNIPLTEGTDTDMDALMSGMGTLHIRKRRGVMGGKPPSSPTRQRR